MNTDEKGFTRQIDTKQTKHKQNHKRKKGHISY